MADLKTQFTPKLLKTTEYPRQMWQGRYSPCGKFVCGAGYDGLVQRWDISGAEPAALPSLDAHKGWVQCLAYAGASGKLVTGDSWGTLACWAYADAAPAPAWKVDNALAAWIRDLAVSPDGATAAVVGNDAACKLFAVADGKLVGELPGHDCDVFSVAFHPDGKTLVTGDQYGVIRCWDLATLKVTRQIDAKTLYKLNTMQDVGGVRKLAFDAAGATLAACGMKEPSGGFAVGQPCVLTFDWAAGKQQHELVFGTKDHGFPYDLVFHPQGFVMTCASGFPNQGHTIFWTPGEKEPFFIGQNLPNGRSISIHPDGKLLLVVASNSSNGNGRGELKDGVYFGGAARLHWCEFPAETPAAG